MQKYQCNTCRYIYDPGVGDRENDIPHGTPFDELPYDWMCPSCASGIAMFEPVQDLGDEEITMASDSGEEPEE